MKILGIGLPRTGGTSLAMFLRKHGYSVSQYVIPRYGYGDAEVIVDFPMQIMFPWLMRVDRDVRAVLTFRRSVPALHQSTRNFVERIVETSNADRICEMHNVLLMLYGSIRPELADVYRADAQIKTAAERFVEEGRVLFLPLEDPDEQKGAAVCKFLGLPGDRSYPHEGKLA